MRALRIYRHRLVRWLIWLVLAAFTAWLSIWIADQLSLPIARIVKPPHSQQMPPTDAAGTFLKFTFEQENPLKGWEEKIFKGRTQYAPLKEKGLMYLRSTSADSSSGLYHKIEMPVTSDLRLAWWWRAQAFPVKKNPEKLANRSEDDFAARMYVIFMGKSLMRSDVLEYIWDERLPVDTIAQSPYSDRIQLWVVQSGASDTTKRDGWVLEERNLVKDYEAAFGRPLTKPLGIIAIMSDSDNTRSQAAADYGDILFKRKFLSEIQTKTEEAPHAPSS